MPLPPGPVTDGVPVWRGADAAAWSAAGPGRWARPLWSVLGLLVAVGAAITVEPIAACTDAHPCGPDWLGLVQTGLAIGLLHWNARLPELALVAAPALAVVVAVEQFPAPGTESLVANLAVLAALGLGWAAACARLTARRRQRLLFERTAGAVMRPFGPKGLPRRGTGPLAAGLVLCAVAIAVTFTCLRDIQAEEDRAARATRTEAEVTGRTEWALRLRTHDGRRLTVDSVFPEDQRTGTTITVLEDGSWRRLAAEPYDPVGREVLVLVTGTIGISLTGTGLLAFRRSLARRLRGLPALLAVRVLMATDAEGTTRVHASDDTDLRTPLFVAVWAPYLLTDEEHERQDETEDETEDEIGGEGEDEWEDTDPDFTLVSLRESVMFGVPHEGAELAFVTSTAEGSPHTAVVLTTVRVPWTARRVSGRGRPATG
ncbi:hypothetical protein ACFWPY_07590 [Streptomyces sp. NPDC058527]